MRLSEAMMLGSTTCRMVARDWDTCAIGAATLAIGRSHGEYAWSWATSAWPWLDGLDPTPDIEWGYSALVDPTQRRWFHRIVTRFDYRVCTGQMTFEQLVDYVRSIEPECGECNKFDCSCVKSEAAPVAEMVMA